MHAYLSLGRWAGYASRLGELLCRTSYACISYGFAAVLAQSSIMTDFYLLVYAGAVCMSDVTPRWLPSTFLGPDGRSVNVEFKEITHEDYDGAASVWFEVQTLLLPIYGHREKFDVKQIVKTNWKYWRPAWESVGLNASHVFSPGRRAWAHLQSRLLRASKTWKRSRAMVLIRV